MYLFISMKCLYAAQIYAGNHTHVCACVIYKRTYNKGAMASSQRDDFSKFNHETKR